MEPAGLTLGYCSAMSGGASVGKPEVSSPAHAPDDAIVDVSTATSVDELTISVLALVATLAAVVVGQGAFQGPSRWLVAAGLTVAVVTGMRRVRTVTTSATHVAIAAIGLVAWVALRGFATSNTTAATAQIGLIAGLVGIVTVCRRSTAAERDALVTTVIAAGLFVAVSGWVGVAFRVEPWANAGPTTWRASSSLTYPNAAAAVIVTALLLCLARRTRRPSARADSAVCCVLVAGLLATQSRGGAVALAVGLAILLVITGWRSLTRTALVPAVGATLAFLIALPGLASNETAQPAAALAGLALGTALAWALPMINGRITSVSALALVPAVAWLVNDRVGGIGSDRIALDSDDRVATMSRAIDAIADAPVLGVGPGNLNLVWRSGDQLLTTGLVHNEYLQLTAELGFVGAALLTLLVIAATRPIVAARASTDPALWAAGVAVLAALAVHSGLDFLWHIPAIPLLAATVFGVSFGDARRPTAIGSPDNITGRRPSTTSRKDTTL
jgi:O-Antigen ligase